MTLLHAAVLGLVQGLTEFLPISSDGHLALAYAWFGLKPDLTYEVFLHGATLLAMYAYFWRDIVHIASSLLPANRQMRDERRLVLLIIAGTFVSGVVAKALEPIVEPMSAQLTWVAIWFLCTSALLFVAELLSARLPRHPEPHDLSLPKTAFVGLMQGLAVLPGLSRSGSTIAASMMSGLDREKGARFSFWLGIPIITLAFGLDAVDVLRGGSHLPGVLPSAVGFAVAAVSGYAAVWGLLRFVKGHKLYPFAIYTAALGVILLASALLGKG